MARANVDALLVPLVEKLSSWLVSNAQDLSRNSFEVERFLKHSSGPYYSISVQMNRLSEAEFLELRAAHQDIVTQNRDNSQGRLAASQAKAAAMNRAFLLAADGTDADTE